MTTTAIILSHYKEREDNLNTIVKDLKNGSVVPEKIIVICDNPDVLISPHLDVDIVRFENSVLPIVRFAIGAIQNTTHCLFVDDDMTIGKDTLKEFYSFAKNNPKSILGFEGNINGQEYTDGNSIEKVKNKMEVDIIIRMYFVPVSSLPFGLQLRSWYPDLPKISLDDVFLCLGNKYIGKRKNIVIPSKPNSLPKELPTGDKGQSLSPKHYINRNIVCRFLKQRYE